MSSTNESFSFLDRFEGAKSGDYKLKFRHHLAGKRVVKGVTSDVDETEEVELSFRIDCPRLRLPADGEVRSVYPPPATTADHEHTLPHIVLRSRSLPWERSLEPTAAPVVPTETPWVALLVLDAADVAAGAVVRSIKGDALCTMPVGHAIVSPWIDRAAQFKLDAAEVELQMDVLEMPAATFRGLCPTVNELPLLAHIRRVSLLDKEDAAPAEPVEARKAEEAKKSGDFAVVVANRRPGKGSNTAVLVSLEGWAPWLAGTDDKGTVRLLVLHSWGFTSTSGDGTFRQRAGQLKSGLARWAPKRGAAPTGEVAEALLSGRIPIAWHRSDGTKRAAWYRGPLSPVETTPFPAEAACFASAESALVERTGATDVSLASAWQIGQLLGLASTGFSAAIRKWNLDQQRDALRGATEFKPVVAEMEAWLASHLASNKAPVVDTISAVTDWLSDLVLLRPVPFRYLVPSAEMLPPETIRLFRVDSRWVEALVDGAMSLDVRAGAPATRESTRTVLKMLVHRRQAARRVRMHGEPPKSDKPAPKAADLPDSRGMSGFLLRSAILGAWPGLEVELWAGETRLVPLRLESVAEGVLLGLTERFPTHLVLKEPREGIRFRAENAKDRAGASKRVVDIKAFADTDKSGAFARRQLAAPEDVGFNFETGAPR